MPTQNYIIMHGHAELGDLIASPCLRLLTCKLSYPRTGLVQVELAWYWLIQGGVGLLHLHVFVGPRRVDEKLACSFISTARP